MNSTVLSGRISTDLELRYTNANVATISFNLAVKREYKMSDGEYKTDFIRCVCWRQTAENLIKYKAKGDWIEVYGVIETRDYINNEGIKKYIVEVQLHKINYPPVGNSDKSGVNYNPKKEKKQQTPVIDITEDDLPF